MRALVAWLGVCLSAAPVGARAGDSTASPSSTPTATASMEDEVREVSAEKQKILVEMWGRHILGTEATAWAPQDFALLQNMREAEALDAVDLLRGRMGTLKSYVVPHGAGQDRTLWLTKAGYDQYLFLKSQLARRYFEEQGTDAKFVFRLRDLNGKRLFNGNGVLTPAGIAVYHQILRGKTVQWKDGAGNILSNARPSPERR